MNNDALLILGFVGTIALICMIAAWSLWSQRRQLEKAAEVQKRLLSRRHE